VGVRESISAQYRLVSSEESLYGGKGRNHKKGFTSRPGLGLKSAQKGNLRKYISKEKNRGFEPLSLGAHLPGKKGV